MRSNTKGARSSTVECSDATQSVKGKSNDMDTCIEGTSVADAEKARQKADSVQSIEKKKIL